MPFFWNVKILNKVSQRGFARTRTPDDTDFLSGLNRQIYILQDKRQVNSVSERNVAQSDCAVDSLRAALAHFLNNRLHWCIQNVADKSEREFQHDNVPPHHQEI